MPTEADRKELIARISAYVSRTQGSLDRAAWQRAFDASDSDGDGRITADELHELLAAADVGNAFTRGAWTRGVLEALDKDGSQTLSMQELVYALSAAPAPPEPPHVYSDDELMSTLDDTQSKLPPDERPNAKPRRADAPRSEPLNPMWFLVGLAVLAWATNRRR